MQSCCTRTMAAFPLPIAAMTDSLLLLPSFGATGCNRVPHFSLLSEHSLEVKSDAEWGKMHGRKREVKILKQKAAKK